jgi:hypothetical protein
MNKLFTEFENENELRTYPFASGCTVKDRKGVEIGVGVLVDAALYPVNPSGDLYLSRIGADGTVSISDDRGVVMTASAEGGTSLEFYDTSDLHRHVGTVVASSEEAMSGLVSVNEDRVFRSENSRFASSCVFPVINDGVTSVNVGDTGAADGDIVFANAPDDQVRVSTDETGTKLRFDVIPRPYYEILKSIKHVYCIVDGKTPFRIMKLPHGGDPSIPGNTIAVYLDNIDRQDICADAHREDEIQAMDTCTECGGDVPCPEPPSPEDIPHVYQAEVVDIPNGADGAFYLAVPNMVGYDNPLSITMQDGMLVPNEEVEVQDGEADIGDLVNRITSKGVVLQVPGLAAIP